MRPIGVRESQSKYVERVLKVDGHISAYGALYDLYDDEGRKRSITRLAAIIEPLRKAGWGIATQTGTGELATYVVTKMPAGQEPTWRCVGCGSEARMEPTPVLGGMGEAYCPTCHASRFFQRKAA